ncbi:MAG: MBL fold metallo-hydrolase [Elusimicrobia bacterium]|nr:MBL fold metallo-hydrolase [Elusimicrobiota bacterium]
MSRAHRASMRSAILLAGLWLAAAPAFAQSPESFKSGDSFVLPSGSLRLGPLTSHAPAPDDPSVSGGALTVTFIDVGQGDSEYIELPNGKTVLIDGGPKKAAISAFLGSRGITHIDHVVMTHPHSDHYNGLGYVFDATQVDNFYDNRVDNASATGDDKIRAKAAAEPGCVLHYPVAGESLDWGPGVEAKVFNSCPEASAKVKSEDLNNCSIVIKLSYAGSAVLFTGDLSMPVEAELVARYGDGLRADVLKVGHHGSYSSSTADFLAKVRPKYAYISLAAGNDYGHPHQVTLDRLAAAGAEVHRTDKEGTMSYTIGRPAAPLVAVSSTR